MLSDPSRRPSMFRSSSASSLVSHSSSPIRGSSSPIRGSMSDDEYALPRRKKGELPEREFRIDHEGKDISVSKPVLRKYPPYEISNELIMSWLEVEEEDMPSMDDTDFFAGLRKYMEGIYVSEGYDITAFPSRNCNGVISIYPYKGILDCERIKSFAVMAIEKYNEVNPWVKYDVVKVLKMNVRFGYVEECYITFDAKNVETGVIKTFQGMVVDNCFEKTVIVRHCRQQPPFL